MSGPGASPPPAPLCAGPDRTGRVVATDGDRIVPPAEVRGRADLRPLPCEDARITPGWVNAHTHLYSALAPLGMPAPQPPPRSFLEILERIWWRLDRALDLELIRASARYGIAQALLAGTTGIVDHHESPAAIEDSLATIAGACHELGARAVLTYGATERNGGVDEARLGLEECARFHDLNPFPLVRAAVGVHASFTVSNASLELAGDIARSRDLPLHVHVAEDASDVQDAERRGFNGPLERLELFAGLPSESILAHGVHLGPAQVRRADDIHCWLVQNPRSNRGNGVGYPQAIRCARRVAVGTDGYPARRGEERAALFEEGARHGEDEVGLEARLDRGRELLAERFRRDAEALTPGALADFVVRGDEGVRHVVVGGRLVVESGALTAAPFAAIESEAREAAARLWPRMEELP